MRAFELARLEQSVDLVNPLKFFFLTLLVFAPCLGALDIQLEPRILRVDTPQGLPLPQSLTRQVLLLVLTRLCGNGLYQVSLSSQTACELLKVRFFRISAQSFFQELDPAIEIGLALEPPPDLGNIGRLFLSQEVLYLQLERL